MVSLVEVVSSITKGLARIGVMRCHRAHDGVLTVFEGVDGFLGLIYIFIFKHSLLLKMV